MLNPFQSAFRKNHSATGLVLDLTENIRRNMDNSYNSLVIILDLCKAFDSLSHEILCRKLQNNFMFDSSACSLLFSFLTNRCQYVEVDGKISSTLKTFRGVPQGSILGPLLFIMYMDDLFREIRFCKCYMYADDVQLLADESGLGKLYLEDNVNNDLKRVVEWCQSNCMSLNSLKSKAMYFSNSAIFPNIYIMNEAVDFVSHHKSLGMYLDTKLDFNFHINYVISRISFTLRKLYCLGTFLPPHVKKRVAISLCLPILLYGIEIFSGTSQQNLSKLRLCFNRVIRFIYNLHYRDHISAQVIEILGSDFNCYIDRRILLQFYRFMKYGKPIYLVDKFQFGMSTRSNTIICPRHSSLYMSRSFVVRISRIWNNYVPYEDRNFNKSITVFKKMLKCYL